MESCVFCRSDFSKTKCRLHLKIVWIVIYININKLTKIYKKIRQKFFIIVICSFYQMCLLWRSMTWNYHIETNSHKRVMDDSSKLVGLFFIPLHVNWTRFIKIFQLEFLQFSILYFPDVLIVKVYDLKLCVFCRSNFS